MSKKCQKTNKTKFNSEKRAGRAMMRIWSHDPSADIYDLHTYVCPDCGYYHVGHKSYFRQSKNDTVSRSNVSSMESLQ